MRLFHYFVDITKPDTLNFSNLWALVRAQRDHAQKIGQLYIQRSEALAAKKQPITGNLLTNAEMASPTIDEVFVQVPLDLPINTDTGMVWDSPSNIDGVNNILNFWLDQNRTVITTVTPKVKGQVTLETGDNNNRHIGTLFTDRSAREMFLVTFARMYTGTRVLLKPKITGSDQSFSYEGYQWGYWEFSQALSAKLQQRWAIPMSDAYNFSVQENFGIESPPGMMVIDPDQVTYLRAPTKPTTISISLSRFQSKFDYPINPADYEVFCDGCSVAYNSAKNTLDLTITGKGTFEIIPKQDARAFILTHNFSLTNLHWRLRII